jgi:hypothetical protein
MGNKTSLIIELFKTMAEENIICAYHGDFNYQVVNGLLINIKRDLSKPDVDRRAAKKTYKVLVECLENINKHASIIESEHKGTPNEGIFILSNANNCYTITVGNLVKNEEEPQLTANFNQVNSMSKDELKILYREIIATTEISVKGGAGLGIVDMALKSESKLQFTFYKYSENLKFLTLDIDIKY